MKQRIAMMLGFKGFRNAAITIAGIPARWTDWGKGRADRARALLNDDTALRSLGSLADLLQLRHLVDALRRGSTGLARKRRAAM